MLCSLSLAIHDEGAYFYLVVFSCVPVRLMAYLCHTSIYMQTDIDIVKDACLRFAMSSTKKVESNTNSNMAYLIPVATRIKIRNNITLMHT